MAPSSEAHYALLGLEPCWEDARNRGSTQPRHYPALRQQVLEILPLVGSNFFCVFDNFRDCSNENFPRREPLLPQWHIRQGLGLALVVPPSIPHCSHFLRSLERLVRPDPVIWAGQTSQLR